MQEPLQGTRLKSFLSGEIRDANTYNDEALDAKRRASWDFYYSRPYGNEVEGRSAVVTSEVQDAIESQMPDLVEVFLEQPGAWSFAPSDQMNAKQAEEASDIVNYVIEGLNDGWTLIHDTLKASLMWDCAYIKTTWWDGETDKTRTIKGQPGIEVVRIDQDPNRTIIKILHADGPSQGNPVEFFVLDGTYDVTVTWDVPGHPKLWGCPYEEIIHTANISTIRDTPFIAHKYTDTRSALVQAGHDPDLIYSLPKYTDNNYDRDRARRFAPEVLRSDNGTGDKSLDEIQLYECYTYGDFNGDGVAEYGMVLTAGTDGSMTILPDPDSGDEVVMVHEHPFTAISAIRLPYKHPGRGVAELAYQPQMESSALRRQINDNMFYATNGRHAINENVDEHDYMNNIPGMPVRVKGRDPIGNSISPIVTEPIIQQAIPYLEFLKAENERRIGAYSGNLLDPEVLNSTFGGINLLMGENKKRPLYRARTMAEGLKDLPRKVLNLLIENQQDPMPIPSGDEWKKIDTRSFAYDARVVVNFGFSNGTQAQRVAMYSQILAKQDQLVAQAGGYEGPFVNVDDYSRTLHEWAEAMGLSASNLAFNDLKDVFEQYQRQMQSKAKAEQAAQDQDPSAMMMKLEQMKIQTGAQAKMEQIQMDERLKRYEIDLADKRERDKIGLKHRSDVLDVNLDHETDMYKATLENQTKETSNVLDYRRQAQSDFLTAATKGTEQ